MEIARIIPYAQDRTVVRMWRQHRFARRCRTRTEAGGQQAVMLEWIFKSPFEEKPPIVIERPEEDTYFR